ncbi:MAG: hypothetical protein QW776_05485 [Candidatus Nitrosocaldus sp.]
MIKEEIRDLSNRLRQDMQEDFKRHDKLRHDMHMELRVSICSLGRRMGRDM